MWFTCCNNQQGSSCFLKYFCGCFLQLSCWLGGFFNIYPPPDEKLIYCLDNSTLCWQYFFLGLALLSVSLSPASIWSSKVLFSWLMKLTSSLSVAAAFYNPRVWQYMWNDSVGVVLSKSPLTFRSEEIKSNNLPWAQQMSWVKLQAGI